MSHELSEYRCHGCGKPHPTYLLVETNEVNVDGLSVELEHRWECTDCGHEEVTTSSE